MTPEAAIAMLNRQLAAHGQDIRLTRNTLGPGGVLIPFSVECRAFVRSYKADELVGGIIQGDTLVVLAPTEIEAQGWPGAEVTPTNQDRRVPRKDDKCVIAGKSRNVEAGTPFYLNGELVRIELQVRG